MSTQHGLHPEPVEDDPTGIHDLLASLPDPGPMPEHLVSRITASLAAERSQATLVDLPRRSHPWRVVLAAAAAALVVIGGGLVLDRGLSGNVAASMASGSGLADQPSAPPTPAPAGGRTVVVTSGRSYSAASLAEQASGLGAAALGGSGLGAPAAGAGGVGTPAGARACAAALGIPSTDPVVVDVATVDGRPAAVVVDAPPSGMSTAYAVGRDCTTGHAALIAGPVSLG